MRVQLLCDANFNTASGGVMLKRGSMVGDGAGDYPIGQISGFAVTSTMFGVDGAGTTAVSGVGGPRYTSTPGLPGGGLPIPPGWSGLNWASA